MRKDRDGTAERGYFFEETVYSGLHFSYRLAAWSSMSKNIPVGVVFMDFL